MGPVQIGQRATEKLYQSTTHLLIGTYPSPPPSLSVVHRFPSYYIDVKGSPQENIAAEASQLTAKKLGAKVTYQVCISPLLELLYTLKNASRIGHLAPEVEAATRAAWHTLAPRFY